VRRFCAILILLFGFRLFADEIIPPPPAAYFNDYTHVVSAGTASQLNTTLENFERQSSDQILVAIFPKMQSDSSVEDYTVRVARSWQAGQKNKNNGAVLFVFVADHKMFLQVGYGLEGVLPDALCKRIIDEQISPRFKAGDFDGGLTAGVQSVIAAAKGEYKGNGRTVADQRQVISVNENPTAAIPLIILLVVVVLFFFLRLRGLATGGISYYGGGWTNNNWPRSGFSSGGGFGGGSFSSGGSFGGGGGGFSGGGGSFGGGGAGGSW
jgi:uncharacterized protein